jgi:hypothetical protein
MPGLFDMLQPQNLQGTEPIGFGDALQQRSNSLIGLGLGLMQPTNPWAGTNAATNALRGYQSGNVADQTQARMMAAQKQHAEDLAFRRSQANREPEAIRTMRLMGIDPNSDQARDLMYPKADNLHEGKITYREQDYPYLRDRRGNYSWPLGRPPAGPGSLPVEPAPASTALPATAAPTAGTTAEAKPPGYDTWLPSTQRKYEQTQAEMAAKQAAAEPEQRAQTLDSANTALRELDAAIKQTDQYPHMVAGTFGNLMKGVPGSQATDVSKRLDVVKANIAFDKLQAMRRASPTGGALGNVSDKDMALLQSALGSLDQAQNPQQLLEGMRNVRTHYTNIVRKVQGAGGGSPQSPSSGGVRRYNPETGKIE